MAHGDRSVDVFIRKLRQKLERASSGWRYIHTHFGIGYRFDPQPTDASPAPHAATRPAGDAPAPREPAVAGPMSA
jgi:DNA-binding winged helix-turn-helix (wHTH) protein